MFLVIRIHRRLTKNHGYFRFPRHFPPVSKQFQKRDLYLIALPSGHQKHQENKKFTFLEILSFFDHFEQNQEARSVFNLTIFQEIDSLISESGKINCSDLRS